MHISPSRLSRRPKILKSSALPTEFSHRQTSEPSPTSAQGQDEKERMKLVTEKSSPARKRIHSEVETVTQPEITQYISQRPGPGHLLTTDVIRKKGPSPVKKKRVVTVTQAEETVFRNFPTTDVLHRKTPSPARKKRLENVADANIPTALMVDVLESPGPTYSAFVGSTPQKMTPLRYSCSHGTPRRVLSDHAYFKKSRTFGTQTDTHVDNKTAPIIPKEVIVQPLELSSPISSEPEEENPSMSSDFEPLPSSSSSGESSDEKESPNPCYIPKYIVFESQLEQLLQFCNLCGSPITEMNKFKTGSMISYGMSCHSGHSYVWRSQPMIRKEPVGHLLISAAILTTGNTFAKLLAFAEHLQLQLISKSVFYKIQKEHLFPVIQDAWEKERQTTVAEIKQTYEGKDLVLSGDARCDSPGHTAKYGSYTLMDASPDVGTRKIVTLQLVQVSEVPNSNHMEPEGLKRCLSEVGNDNLNVSILASDRHVMVNSIMDKEYKKIQHQFDTWHVSKGVVKKLSTKAKGKEYTELTPWIQSISNHL